MTKAGARRKRHLIGSARAELHPAIQDAMRRLARTLEKLKAAEKALESLEVAKDLVGTPVQEIQSRAVYVPATSTPFFTGLLASSSVSSVRFLSS